MPQEGSLVGMTLDGYRLTKLLGVGGMAEVYLADEPSLKREVAVKVLPRALAADPNYVERFRNEARHVANLSHPNIVPVYNFGEYQGLLYLVMPLLKESLRDRMEREHTLPAQDAARITYAIASALHTAHQHGIVHRDVKPENILIDNDRKSMLTDFGIARELEALREGGVARTLAATGLPVGTPEYMAPEQLRGMPATPQVDLYALGVVLYEMVTGRVPHDAATPYEVATAALRDPITPPTRINPDISPAMEQVILRAMAREPESRYSDMKAFALDLRDALTGRKAVTNSLRWTQFMPASRGGPSALPSRPLEPEELDRLSIEPSESGRRPAPPMNSTEKRPALAAGAALGAMGAMEAMGAGTSRAASGKGRLLRNTFGSMLGKFGSNKGMLAAGIGAVSVVLVVALVGGGLAVSAMAGMFTNDVGNAGAKAHPTATTLPTNTSLPTATSTPAATNTPYVLVQTATPNTPNSLAFTPTTLTLSAGKVCSTTSPLIIQNFEAQSVTWRWMSISPDPGNDVASNLHWSLTGTAYSNSPTVHSQPPFKKLNAYAGQAADSSALSLSLYNCSSSSFNFRGQSYTITFKDFATNATYQIRLVVPKQG